MSIARIAANLYWRISKWNPATAPAPDQGIILGAPHTSNWDFILMLATGWKMGLKFKWLGKSQMFPKPLAGLMRALGGIPVDRSNPHGLVEDLVRRAEAGEKYLLVITPEGTRAEREYWKSGFYRIARQTGLPVVLGFIDRDNRLAGLGPTIHLTGDMSRDMDVIREFYAGKQGVRDKPLHPPRLREEEAAGN